MRDTQPVVLLVACKPSTRLMLEMFLLSKGLQVFAARSVQSALLQLRVLYPDLIILDGTETGNACAEIVSQLKQLSSAPVLVFRNAVSGAHRQPAVDGYLTYPVDIADLSAQVTCALERRNQDDDRRQRSKTL